MVAPVRLMETGQVYQSTSICSWFAAGGKVSTLALEFFVTACLLGALGLSLCLPIEVPWLALQAHANLCSHQRGSGCNAPNGVHEVPQQSRAAWPPSHQGCSGQTAG